MLYPTKMDYRRKEAPRLGKGVSTDGTDERIIVNRRSRTNSCNSLRGLGRHAAFYGITPKDVQLVGRGAGLRVADLSWLKFVFINLGADLAEPSYCLTALRAEKKLFQSSVNLRAMLSC